MSVEEGLSPEQRPDRFLEFRRKVQDADMLSASMLRLIANIRFTGRLSIVVQNGRVLKSGYEEGYFTRRHDPSLIT